MSQSDKKYLLSLPGIGEKTVDKYEGITRRNIMKNIKKFPLITQLTLIWKPEKKIPHDDVPDIVSKFAKKQKIIVTGSWRRGKETSGDIDILVLEPDKFREHLLILQEEKKTWVPISAGSKKMSGIFIHNYPVKIDLWFVDDPRFLPFMKLYSTGSAVHNIIMRRKAKNMELKLDQYGLTKISNGRKIALSSEREIFEYLGMSYKTPRRR
ncbi:MAG: nucleotidyltransferase domain-containing protein [Saprospiraceae bacterium]|nr:nucleotidyltransferase domain-containing protein [Saprospiraceae bacterium]